MNGNRGFWQTSLGKVIRWTLFFPIGYGILAFTSALLPVGVEWASGYKPEFSFLVLAIAVVVVPTVCSAGLACLYSVGAVPYLCCTFIAPNPKVGSVIFGTLFCLFYGPFIWTLFGQEHTRLFIAYHFLVAAIAITGIVVAYMTPQKVPRTLADPNR